MQLYMFPSSQIKGTTNQRNLQRKRASVAAKKTFHWPVLPLLFTRHGHGVRARLLRTRGSSIDGRSFSRHARIDHPFPPGQSKNATNSVQVQRTSTQTTRTETGRAAPVITRTARPVAKRGGKDSAAIRCGIQSTITLISREPFTQIAPALFFSFF